MKDEQKNSTGFVLWLTGLSGAGKTTIAEQLYKRLDAMGKTYERLDGDVLRGVFPGTGFSKESRDEHIKRVGFMLGAPRRCRDLLIHLALPRGTPVRTQSVQKLYRSLCHGLSG